MAVTATEFFKSEVEGRRMHVYKLAFDDSYPTGGEAIAAGDVGLTRIDDAIIAPTDGYVFSWDRTNGKILAYWVDTTTDGAKMAQVVDTTDINANLTAVLAIFFGL